MTFLACIFLRKFCSSKDKEEELFPRILLINSDRLVLNSSLKLLSNLFIERLATLLIVLFNKGLKILNISFLFWRCLNNCSSVSSGFNFLWRLKDWLRHVSKEVLSAMNSPFILEASFTKRYCEPSITITLPVGSK